MACESRTQGVTMNRIGQRNTFLWNPASGGLAFCRLPRERVLHSRPWVLSDDRPVAAKSQDPAAVLHCAPRPTSQSAFRADVSGPYLQGVVPGIRMERLEARDHTELAEPREIGRRRVFNVLDAMTAISSVVHCLGML